jgi:hypothetical protein
MLIWEGYVEKNKRSADKQGMPFDWFPAAKASKRENPQA